MYTFINCKLVIFSIHSNTVIDQLKFKSLIPHEFALMLENIKITSPVNYGKNTPAQQKIQVCI